MLEEIISTEVKSYKIIENKSWFVEKRVDIDKKELFSSEKSKGELVCITYDMVMGKEEKTNLKYWDKYWKSFFFASFMRFSPFNLWN